MALLQSQYMHIDQKELTNHPYQIFKNTPMLLDSGIENCTDSRERISEPVNHQGLPLLNSCMRD